MSLDVCQTTQDFVTSPNSISTFCSHFISGIPRTSTNWLSYEAEMSDKVSVQINHSHSQMPKEDLYKLHGHHTHMLKGHRWSSAPVTPQESQEPHSEGSQNLPTSIKRQKTPVFSLQVNMTKQLA